MLLAVLDTVYVDTRNTEVAVNNRPKAVFELMFTEAESLIPSR